MTDGFGDPRGLRAKPKVGKRIFRLTNPAPVKPQGSRYSRLRRK